MGRGSGTYQLSYFTEKKDQQAAAAPTLVTSHYAEIDTHFSFFLPLPSLFYLWTVAVDPADILNYCGMLRGAQVPGNLTLTGSAKCTKGLFMSSDRGRRRKEDRGDNKRNLFLFPGLSAPQ